MEFGLDEAVFVYNLEECDEDDRCFTIQVDEKYKILENPMMEENQTIDCENTE